MRAFVLGILALLAGVLQPSSPEPTVRIGLTQNAATVTVKSAAPFTIQQRVSDTDAINEGFYVFDPGAFGPHCGTVKLVLYSEKDPAKADTRVVDPKIVQAILSSSQIMRARSILKPAGLPSGPA